MNNALPSPTKSKSYYDATSDLVENLRVGDLLLCSKLSANCSLPEGAKLPEFCVMILEIGIKEQHYLSVSQSFPSTSFKIMYVGDFAEKSDIGCYKEINYVWRTWFFSYDVKVIGRTNES